MSQVGLNLLMMSEMRVGHEIMLACEFRISGDTTAGFGPSKNVTHGFGSLKMWCYTLSECSISR